MLGDRLAQPTHLVESSYASALTYESGEAPFDDPYLPSPKRVDAVLVTSGVRSCNHIKTAVAARDEEDCWNARLDRASTTTFAGRLIPLRLTAPNASSIRLWRVASTASARE